MRLVELAVHNFRSIRDSGAVKVNPLQAFVGENNSGKSNLLAAIECLTCSGAGGVDLSDFNAADQKITIRGTFDGLGPRERRIWASYLVGGKLILEKHLWIEGDEQKQSVKHAFHGYRAEPAEWHLSITKIEERAGARPNWTDIVAEHNLPEYFLVEGRSNKTIFKAALERYLEENEVAYDEPDLSETQALGISSRVVATLPAVYMLKAITDYSSEIDRRSTTTTFRRLMGALADRIIRRDPRYQELERALNDVRRLLNGLGEGNGDRLTALPVIEARMTELLRNLMPAVEHVRMRVEMDSLPDVFSRGVQIRIDDGVETEVLAKGHGLQRCMVFTLLEALIMSERGALVAEEEPVAAPAAAVAADPPRSIVLLVEEPELYIHPQLCRLFFDAMTEFATTDQVIYATHSPLFIDAARYESIAVVRKDDPATGTRVQLCDTTPLDDLPRSKQFKLRVRLDPAVNEMFFARKVLLVEGPQDRIAVTGTLVALGRIRHRVEELGVTMIVAGGKPPITDFQRILNAFRIPYLVLHDLDLREDMKEDDRRVQEQRNADIAALAQPGTVFTFPVTLEASLGLAAHLDCLQAADVFTDETKITQPVRDLIARLGDAAGGPAVAAEPRRRMPEVIQQALGDALV